MSGSIDRSRLGTPGRSSYGSVIGQIGAALTAAVERLLDWQQRSAQRRHLAALDDRMLRDIGITRVDVIRELHKAPWQR